MCKIELLRLIFHSFLSAEHYAHTKSLDYNSLGFSYIEAI